MENPPQFKLYINTAVVATVCSTYKATRDSCYNWLDSSVFLQFYKENSVQHSAVGCQGHEDIANFCLPVYLLRANPTMPRAPFQSPCGHQSLPQQHHIRAALQLPTALPWCPQGDAWCLGLRLPTMTLPAALLLSGVVGPALAAMSCPEECGEPHGSCCPWHRSFGMNLVLSESKQHYRPQGEKHCCILFGMGCLKYITDVEDG